jgi:hypothetical protein
MITPFSQKMVEAWNSGNVEDIGEMYASDVQVLHSMVPTALNGRDAVVQFEGSMFASFSEIHWEATRLSSRSRPPTQRPFPPQRG